MKKSMLVFFAALLLALAVMGAAACDPPAPKPIQVSLEKQMMELDLYGAGKNAAEINIADYIDENRAKGVTYTIREVIITGATENVAQIEISGVKDKKFTVAAVSNSPIGFACVEIEAFQNGELKAASTIRFEIVDSTPIG